ncbi:MAG: response regulator transcription factor [Novosphingobium sp.]
MSHCVHVICANPITREGLGTIIAAQGFAAGQAVGSLREIALDSEATGLVVLVDLGPAEQSIAVRTVVAASPRTRPLILAPAFDFETMTACLREGAVGYLISNLTIAELIEALHLSLNGQKVLPSTLADELSRQRDRAAQRAECVDDLSRDQMKNLSQRERDVLCCLVGGYPNKVIARRLEVSEATVKANVKAILRKLNVLNRTQAAIWARQQGALDC